MSVNCVSTLSLSQILMLRYFFTCRDRENGYTALMYAAIEGDEIIVDVLIACVSMSMFSFCVHKRESHDPRN